MRLSVGSDLRYIALTFIASLMTLNHAARASQAPITIDGGFDEWEDILPWFIDPSGDDGPGGLDLSTLWIADDDAFVFIRLEVGDEINLSEDNDLRIYLDTDASASTGLAVNGIGAELEWRCGERVGFFHVDGGVSILFHEDISFRAGPSVSSTEFEMAFARDAMPDGEHVLFPGNVIRVFVRDGTNGDQMPAAGQTIMYSLDFGSIPPQETISLARIDPDDLRVITYNVQNDSPWNGSREAGFERQMQAVDPDIICFQEIYEHSPAQTSALVETWQPDVNWFASGVADCKTISKYPILDTWALDGNIASLIDTTARLGSVMLLINAHLPCCDDDAGRQEEVDQIAAFIRDAMDRGDLPAESPIIIAGDMNFVGDVQQLETLLAGDIDDEASFGSDAPLDWDGSELTRLLTRQTAMRMGYTWRSDSSSFWPGHLDYVIHTDSVLDLTHSFILYTPEMSAAALAETGLTAGDSLVSDHLLMCADFRVVGCEEDLDASGEIGFADLLQLLAAWGPCERGPQCAADLDHDGAVGFADLLVLLANWGPCQ